MSLVNPFLKILKDNQWSLNAMAGKTGVAVPTLQQVFNGAIKSPRTLLTGLQSLGYNAEALAREYEAWRQALLLDAREQVGL